MSRCALSAADTETGTAGHLVGIAVKPHRRAPLVEVERAAVTADAGLEGDCRGRPGKRQLTAMTQQGWARAAAQAGHDGPWTDRRVNLLLDGLDLRRSKGAVLQIGAQVRLAITGECAPCSRMDAIRPGLAAALAPDWRGGATLRVLSEGWIAVGDPVVISQPENLNRRYPRRPWVGIGVVVIAEGHVLLVRRARPPRQGEWGLPGGAQHLGETIFDGARREVLEETGLDIRPLTVLDAIDSLHRDAGGGVEYHYTLVEVLAVPAAPGLPPVQAGDDAAEVRWVPLDAIDDHLGWEVAARLIRTGAAWLAR